MTKKKSKTSEETTETRSLLDYFANKACPICHSANALQKAGKLLVCIDCGVQFDLTFDKAMSDD